VDPTRDRSAPADAESFTACPGWRDHRHQAGDVLPAAGGLAAYGYVTLGNVRS
jgi:hypothetical protein